MGVRNIGAGSISTTIPSGAAGPELFGGAEATPRDSGDAAMRGSNGLVQGIGIVCEEVTERLAAELKLAESEAGSRIAQEVTPLPRAA